jgi:hypothetical protein
MFGPDGLSSKDAINLALHRRRDGHPGHACAPGRSRGGRRRVVPWSLALCQLAVARAGDAQAAPAPRDSTRHDANVWLVYNGRHDWSSRWVLVADAQVRRSSGATLPKQFLIRPGLAYMWRHDVRLTVGYAYQRTAPQGLLADAIATDEHRAWQQVEVAQPAGLLALDHRLRLEQRWQEDVSAGAAPRVTGWAYQNRARYQLRATRSLQGSKPTAPGWYATATEEPFVRWGGAPRRTFDQNRVFAGLGHRWRNDSRLEVGYLNQYARAGAGRAREINHVLQVTLVSEAPLRRSAR